MQLKRKYNKNKNKRNMEMVQTWQKNIIFFFCENKGKQKLPPRTTNKGRKSKVRKMKSAFRKWFFFWGGGGV